MGRASLLRLWLKETTRPELTAWVSGIAVAVLLVGWVAYPVGTDDPQAEQLVAEAPAGQPETSGQAPVAGAAPGSGVNSTSPVAGGVEGPARGSAGSVGTGTGSTPGGTGSTGSRPASGSPRAQALSATDRGVTAKEIKVAFLAVNLAGIGAAGAVVGIREDIPQVVQALVADANRRGGAAGRRIVPKIYRVDPLNTNDLRAKCLQMTQTDKVFAVSDSGLYIQDSTASCLTLENKTPVLGTRGLTAAYHNRAGALHVTSQKDLNRLMADQVFGARDAGMFDPRRGFTRVGLLTEGCVASALEGRNSLRSYLHAVGLKDSQISEFRASCDAPTSQREMSQAVVQHKGDNVSVVLPTIIHTSFVNYLQQAKLQMFRPKFFASDYAQFTSDVVAETFPAEQWDGTMATSQRRDGELNRTKKLSALAQRCSKVLSAAGLPGITEYGRDGEALAHCQNLDLFTRLANTAGANLTRARFTGALSTVGRFEMAREHAAKFDRVGKYTGGDFINLVVWRKSCTCWVATTGVRPAFG